MTYDIVEAIHRTHERSSHDGTFQAGKPQAENDIHSFIRFYSVEDCQNVGCLLKGSGIVFAGRFILVSTADFSG